MFGERLLSELRELFPFITRRPWCVLESLRDRHLEHEHARARAGPDWDSFQYVCVCHRCMLAAGDCTPHSLLERPWLFIRGHRARGRACDASAACKAEWACSHPAPQGCARVFCTFSEGSAQLHSVHCSTQHAARRLSGHPQTKAQPQADHTNAAGA